MKCPIENMAKKSLLKELEKQDPEELLRLLNEMIKRFPVAKMYLSMEFGLEGTTIIEKYQREIYKEYFPKRGTGKARSSKVNKILKEFSLISAFRDDLVEMYWFQVQNAILYYQTYVHDYEPFLNNLFKNWKIFLDMAREEDLLSTYESKMEALFTERFKRYWLYAQLMNILNSPPESVEEASNDE